MGQKVQQPIDQIDRFTGFPVVVQSDHSYIHNGIGFNLSGTTGSLAAASTWSISFTTPGNSKYIHLRPTGLSSTANTLQCRIAESSIMSSGSVATPINRNRNSKNVSLVTIATGATLTSEGSNILQYAQVGAGTNAGNATGGGADGSSEEWVLKPNTTYSIRFENVGSVTATVGYFNLFWYEESAGS